MWAPLFRLKFFEYADNISAAWIWTRFKRVGTSRKSLMQEELGYIEGGSETLVNALTRAIAERGGTFRLNAPVTRVETRRRPRHRRHGRRRFLPADAVISTMPTPHVSRIVPDLPDEERARYDAIANIGVVCVVFRLKRSITPHFWVNIVDPRFEIPGIVEFSNLRPTGDTVVYIPYYMPVTHPKFAKDDAFFRAEGFGYLKLINPALREEDVVGVLCRAAASRPAGLPAGLRRDAAAGRDLDRRAADRRHLLLLSGGSRHLGERALRQADGGARAVTLSPELRRFILFLFAGGTAALVNILSRIVINWFIPYEVGDYRCLPLRNDRPPICSTSISYFRLRRFPRSRRSTCVSRWSISRRSSRSGASAWALRACSFRRSASSGTPKRSLTSSASRRRSSPAIWGTSISPSAGPGHELPCDRKAPLTAAGADPAPSHGILSGRAVRALSLVGGVALVCHWLSRFAFNVFVSYAWAIVLAYLVGILVAFILNKIYVFPYSQRSLNFEMSFFFLVNIAAFPFVWAVAYVLGEWVLAAAIMQRTVALRSRMALRSRFRCS